MRGLVFIIGMRRSGTSFLRELLMLHPDIGDILFEPHHFMFSMAVSEMVRYHSDEYVTNAIGEMRKLEEGTKWNGAKIALNPGIEAMAWKRIRSYFPAAKYVFITRNPSDTHYSWVRTETSVRGVCDFETYLPWWRHIVGSYRDTGGSCHLDYDRLVDDTDSEMSKVWDLLRIDRINGLNERAIK